MGENILEVVLKARDEASKTIENLGKSVENTQKKTENMSKAFGVAGAIITGIGVAGVVAMKGWIDKAADAESEMAKVDAIIRTVAGTNETAFTNIKKYVNEASEAYIKLGFDDETTAVSFSRLFKATMDTNEANKLLALSADLARYRGVDLETATTAVMKASTGSTRELKAMGVELGKTADAEDILAKLHEVTANQAKNFADTYAGKMLAVKVSIDNVQEALGDKLLPIVKSLADKLLILAENFNKMDPKKIDLIVKSVLAITGISLVLGPLLLLIAALPALGAGFTLLMGPLGLVLLAVAALGFAAFEIIMNWDAVKKFFAQAWIVIVAGFQAATKWIGDEMKLLQQWFKDLPDNVGKFFTELFTVKIPYLIGYIYGWLSVEIPKLVTDVEAWFMALPPKVAEVFRQAYQWIVDHITAAWTWISTNVPTWPGKIYDFIVSIPAKVSGIFNDVKDGAISKMTDLWEGVKKIWDDIKGIFDSISKAANDAWNAATKAFNAGSSAGVKGSRAIGGWINDTGLYMMHAGEYVLSNGMLNGTQAVGANVNTNSNNRTQSIVNYNYIQDISDIDRLGQRLAFQLATSGRL